MRNLVLNTDSYKTSHFAQYPANTRFISSYIESRGGVYPATLFFGLQMFIKEYLARPVSRDDVDEAEAILLAHGVPFNRAGWDYIVEQLGGRLPVEIEAVPEGTLLPNHNVMLQLINTDPKCAWLTSYLETALLRAIWYPSTVATRSLACRQLIGRYLDQTADDSGSLSFRLHDFGARGVSSQESAALGACAHLVSFQGTDTLAGVLAARRYYGADMAGFSIPAAEHSTITSWGRDGEEAAYANMLRQFGGKDRIVAVVSDSYDLWHAIDEIWGGSLREQVQQMGGTLVVRPDSGDPLQVVPEAIERLMARFGSRSNDRGYRVLPDCVRLIQGDGVSLQAIAGILAELERRGISAENLSFGMGGELLQKVNRDTQKFAMKASAICTSFWRDICKNPVTDPSKRSKSGRLALIRDEAGQYQTVRRDTIRPSENLLVPVFRDGELLVDYRFDEIRQRETESSIVLFPQPA